MSNEVMLEPSDLSFPWSYVALGHLHQAKEVVPGTAHMRYAGSIERMDHGERHDEKSAVLLEIKDRQLVQTPRLLPLQSTSFCEIEIHDPVKEIPELAERYSDEKKTLVRYILHWDSSLHDLESLYREIEAIFPRWYQRTAIDVRSGAITRASLTFQQSSDVVGTTRHYLQEVLKNRTETERGELLSLAEQLFVEEGLA
jgi:exonuclease SbcD